MASKPIESLFSNSPCTKIKMRCGPAIAVASQSAVRLGCEAELAHPIAHTRNLLLRIQSDLNQRQFSVERRALVQNPDLQRAVVGLSDLEAEDHRQNTILSRPDIYKGELGARIRVDNKIQLRGFLRKGEKDLRNPLAGR